MEDNPPLWADLLLTAWVLVVAVIFFGVYFAPVIGVWTDAASAFYLVMVLVSAVMLGIKYLRRKISPNDGGSRE